MRLLIALMICSCTMTYAQDQDVGSEAPEVTVADDSGCDEVAAVTVDSLHDGKGGCGCGKPKV
jgi:hypothetical protein